MSSNSSSFLGFRGTEARYAAQALRCAPLALRSALFSFFLNTSLSPNP